MTNQQIRDIIGRPAAVEQLAEECVELGHALMKYSRVLRKQNPTPVTMEEAWEKCKGEFSDVLTCAEVAGLQSDLSLMWEKRQRWIERLQEATKE